MKKPLIIVLIAILVLAIIVGVIFLVFNKEKTAITPDEFMSIMQKNGYSVLDETNTYKNYDYIEKLYRAATNDHDYEIDFYLLSNESYANQIYKNNKNFFKDSKGNNSTETNEDSEIRSKYTLLTKENYYVVSKIDNTVICLNVKSSFKNDVDNILDKLGY